MECLLQSLGGLIDPSARLKAIHPEPQVEPKEQIPSTDDHEVCMILWAQVFQRQMHLKEQTLIQNIFLTTAQRLRRWANFLVVGLLSTDSKAERNGIKPIRARSIDITTDISFQLQVDMRAFVKKANVGCQFSFRMLHKNACFQYLPCEHLASFFTEINFSSTHWRCSVNFLFPDTPRPAKSVSAYGRKTRNKIKNCDSTALRLRRHSLQRIHL